MTRPDIAKAIQESLLPGDSMILMVSIRAMPTARVPYGLMIKAIISMPMVAVS